MINFLRNLITTYISLEKKISNGVPKYDGITDTWKMLPSTIFPADMYNAVSLDEENFKIQAILEQNEIDRKKIFFSQTPQAFRYKVLMFICVLHKIFFFMIKFSF